MGEQHSEQKGKRPLILSADRFTERTEFDGKETYFEGTRITIELPREFDFEKEGKRLLRSIKSAANLFTREHELFPDVLSTKDDQGGRR